MVTAPRSEKGGALSISNSSSIQPTPAPTMRRPFDRTSSVASILAVSSGLRYGTIMTLVTKRMRSVTPAKNARVVICSGHSPPPMLPPDRIFPVKLYGYTDSTRLGWRMWSGATMQKKPSRSPS